MDCEKFEASMLDELYGELDELTLAASKRHVGGCARCSTLMAGLRATRKLVTLPTLAPSEGFESRLLSAVHAAEAKPKLGLAQVISLAGRWAMRPQTAMAAVFLLMVGTSSVLVSRKAPRSAMDGASSAFTVTENGSPAAAAAPAPTAAASGLAFDDPRAAAAAHGTAPIAPAAPQGLAMKSLGSLGNGPGSPPPALDEGGSADRSYAPKARASAPGRGAAFGGDSLGAIGQGVLAQGGPGVSGGGGGGAPAEKGRGIDDISNHSDARFAPPPPPPAAVAATPAAAPQTQGGCAQLDQTASGAWGSTDGYDATLEGARCYAALGQTDAARSRYARLLSVPAYATRAQQGINAISMIASKSPAKRASAKPVAIAPTASTPPAPAAAEVDSK